jgi:hypothetical protein
VPALHGTHAAAPAAAPKLPTPHSKQLDDATAPVAVEYVPGAHGVQA